MSGSTPAARAALSQASRRAGSVRIEFQGVFSRLRAIPRLRKSGSLNVSGFWSAMASRAPVPGAGRSGVTPWPLRTFWRCLRAVCGAWALVVSGGLRASGRVPIPVLPPSSPPPLATIAAATPATMSATTTTPAFPKRPISASVERAQHSGYATSCARAVFSVGYVKSVFIAFALSILVAASATAAPPAVHTGATGRVAVASWYYKGDPGNRGLARGWRHQRFAGKLVTVPYVPNAWPVTGTAGRRNFNGSVGWYRTTLSVPKAGAYALRFESVNHRAAVWVDGKLVGKHRGVYMPFEVRSTLTAGKHLVVVRADWRNPVPQMKREGWHRGWFNYGGINREVTLRRLQLSEIEAPVIQTKLGAGVAHVSLSIRVQNRGGTRVLAPEASLVHGASIVPVKFDARTVKAGSRGVFSSSVDVRDPALWSPAAPELYDLRIGVPGENEGGWEGRVGLRQLTVKAHHPYLNGKPLFLYGASLHEDARGHGDGLTPADMDRLVGRLKAIGANATRAQHALNPALLERLDAAGVLVWQEIGPWDSPGNWTSKTPFLRHRALLRDVTTVEQLRTHPSVLAWTLGNEVAHNGHPGGQASYVDVAARRLHRLDPGRPVALDVWGSALPANGFGALYRNVDVIGVTLYEG